MADQYINFPVSASSGSGTDVNIHDSLGNNITNGQKTMANSVPVVIASDQSSLPVTFTPSGTQDVNLTKVGGSSVTLGQNTLVNSIPVAIASNQSSLSVLATQLGAWSVGRTWTLSSGTDSVDVSGSTITVSGTVTANQGGTWSVGRTWTLSSGTDSVDTELASAILADDSTAAPTTAPTYSFLMGFKSGTNQWARGRMAADNADSISTDATGHLQVLSHNIAFNGTSWDRVRSAGTNSDALATTTVGTVYSNSFGMLFNGTTWDRIRGDTTNGIDVDVTRVSGTVTISGTVTANQGGTWNITNISGTISLPTGAATEASLAKLTLSQGSTTSGQAGPLIQGAVTTAAPSYSTGQTSPLSLTTAGALRVDLGSSTVTVSGSVNATLQSGTNTVGYVLAAATSSSTNLPTRAVSTALEASRVVKASAGTLYRITGYNSKTSAQFIQVFNNSSLPADGAGTLIFTFRVAASSNFSLDFGTLGEAFSVGIVVCNSSTAASKTIGSADCFFTIGYA